MTTAAGIAIRSSETTRVETAPVWFGVLLVLALWLLARPYVGLRHDGIVYLAQALRHLNPQAMSVDIFFANGSQDSFTIFGRLLALLYARWQVASVQIVVLWICHGAMLLAVWRLLTDLHVNCRWLALVALATFSHVYGGFGLLSFSERFVTARTPVEPLAIAALALLLSGRSWASAALLAACVVIHPLMTLPALLVAWIWLVQQNRRWLWAAAAGVAPVALALAGLAPFDGLLRQYDEDWLQPVSHANAMVFLAQWSFEDWQVVAFDVAVLALGSNWLPGRLAPLCRAVIVAAALLFSTSFVAADLLHNVLVTQLQVWRVMWIVHVLALAVLPAVLFRPAHRAGAGRLFAVALFAAAVAVNFRWQAGWALMLWAALTLWMWRSQTVVSPTVQSASMWATVTAVIGLSLVVFASNLDAINRAAGDAAADHWSLALATLPTLSFIVPAALILNWRQRRPVTVAAMLSIGLLGAWGAATWDRRPAWTLYIESGLRQQHPFAQHIPAGAQVYWGGNVAATWVLLKRASYFSPEQGSGILFHRATALEIERRQKVFEPIEFQRALCDTLAGLNDERKPDKNCWPTDDAVELTCRTPQGPDFLIFERAIPAALVSQWTFAGPRADDDRTYYLHDCAKLR